MNELHDSNCSIQKPCIGCLISASAIQEIQKSPNNTRSLDELLDLMKNNGNLELLKLHKELCPNSNLNQEIIKYIKIKILGHLIKNEGLRMTGNDTQTFRRDTEPTEDPDEFTFTYK